jgi:hypothetical protein
MGSVAVRHPDRAPRLTNRNDSITPMLSLLPTIQDRDHHPIDAIAGLGSAQRTDLRRQEVGRD